jgi:hypothetical protein
MGGKNIASMILFIIGLLLGLLAIIISYFGLPGNLDTEPILGFGLIIVAIAGILLTKE